jgi:hypothetical protein
MVDRACRAERPDEVEVAGAADSGDGGTEVAGEWTPMPPDAPGTSTLAPSATLAKSRKKTRAFSAPVLPDLPPLVFPVCLTSHRELATSRRIRVFDLRAEEFIALGR